MDEMLLVCILLRNKKHQRYSNLPEVSYPVKWQAVSGFNDKDDNVGQHAPVFSACW